MKTYGVIEVDAETFAASTDPHGTAVISIEDALIRAAQRIAAEGERPQLVYVHADSYAEMCAVVEASPEEQRTWNWPEHICRRRIAARRARSVASGYAAWRETLS